VNERLEKERKEEVKAVISLCIVLGILLITALGIGLLVLNKRKAKEVKKDRPVPAVDVVTLEKASHQVQLSTQGIVESMQETRLAAEVSGRVLEISETLKRGGIVKKGERLVQIEAADYRSALASAKVRHAEANLQLEQEKARGEQARLDWKKIGSGAPLNPLVLRKPYLKAAQANAAATLEAVAKARRDVERTEIFAPFNAGIRAVHVELGSFVAPGAVVAELYANTQLEVRLPLSLEDFGFLQRTHNGKVISNISLHGRIGAKEYTWQAELSRTDPEISRSTLSAHITARVLPNAESDFSTPPVGLFVRADVSGKTLEGISEIPRRALLEDKKIIVVGEGEKIEFRELEILRMTKQSAVVRGLEVGERIVLTRLGTPIAGMLVKTQAKEAK
jgi:multidrug efflux system membrane fusion protein